MVEAKGLTIPWNIISKKMEKRSRLSCFKKWQKMCGSGKVASSEKQTVKKKKKKTKGAKIDGDEDDDDETMVKSEQTETIGALGDPATAGAANSTSISNDPDVLLLSALVSSQAKRASDVDWDDIDGVEDPQERWSEILEEFQATTTDDEVLALPISDIANAILDQKSSARQAAETVVDGVLPHRDQMEV
jgi:hypothetical protein